MIRNNGWYFGTLYGDFRTHRAFLCARCANAIRERGYAAPPCAALLSPTLLTSYRQANIHGLISHPHGMPWAGM
jgi:hypothetical protein